MGGTSGKKVVGAAFELEDVRRILRYQRERGLKSKSEALRQILRVGLDGALKPGGNVTPRPVWE